MNDIQHGFLLLAAGNSSRLGYPKQLVELNEKPLIAHIVEEVRKIYHQIHVIVVGVYEKEIKACLSSKDLDFVFNPHWKAGIGTSISCGVKYLLEKVPSLETITVLTTDQYFVSSAHLLNLQSHYVRFNHQGKTIIASEYNELAGVPALFDKTEFEKLKNLGKDVGARKIILQASNENKVIKIPFPDGQYDLDTPEDHQKLVALIANRNNVL